MRLKSPVSQSVFSVPTTTTITSTLISNTPRKFPARSTSLLNTLKSQLTKPKLGVGAALQNACTGCGNMETCCVASGKALPSLGLPFLGCIMKGWSEWSPRALSLGLRVSLPKGKTRGNKRTWVVSLVPSPSQIQTKMSE